MTIDIRYKTGQFKLAFVSLLALFVGFMIYSVIEGIAESILAFIFSFVFLLTYFFLLLIKPYYFYYNDDKTKLIIRFYHSHPIFRVFKAYEIPKNIISGYQISKSFLGLRKELKINIEQKNKTGGYPPVSLTLLSSKELKELEKSLKNLSDANSRK